MERKSLIIGIILIVVGLVGRHSPRVVTGISFWTIAEAAGIVLLLRALWIRRQGIRSWVLGAPLGKQVAMGGLLLIIVLFLEFGAGVSRELEAGRKYDPVAADLEKDDPVAALSLARHYRSAESAPLRERIVTRMGELGNSSRDVTGTLREAVRADTDASVRSAAADSLVKLMTPSDVLSAILELPHLPPETRSVFVDILSRRTGKEYGENAGRWLDWAVSGWIGEKGEAAYQLALTAWKGSVDQPTAREACLLRLEDPEGVSEQALASTLRHENPRVRGAAAKAMGRTHANRWRGVLENALKSESDAQAASGMATALLNLDPDRAGMALIDAAQTARDENGRNAALSALAAKYPTGGGNPDLPDLVYAVRETLPAGADRRKTLDLLVRMAKGPGSAHRHLKRILGDGEESSLDRGRALDGLLGTTEEEFTNQDLVALLVDPPSADFAEKVRGALRRRTGKDGGRDAEAWRKILEDLD